MSETNPEDGQQASTDFTLLYSVADPRDDEQLARDIESARAQRKAMEAAHDIPWGVNAILAEMIERRNAAAAMTSRYAPVAQVPAAQVAAALERPAAARDGGEDGPGAEGPREDGGDEGGDGDGGGGGDGGDDGRVVLIIPDMLIVRRSALGLPEGEDVDEDSPLDVPEAVLTRLARNGYRPVHLVENVPSRRSSLVEQFVRVPQPGDEDMTILDRIRRTEEDAVRVREDAEIPVNITYVATCGQIVKGNNHAYPAQRRLALSPHDVRRFVGTRPVKVAVIDTGIGNVVRQDGWLDGIPRHLATFDVIDPIYSPADPQRIDFSGGHGSFVAGVIEQVTPGSTIVVYQAADANGFGTEKDVAEAILQAAKDGATVINVSLGLNTADDAPPDALQAAVETVERLFPDTLIVASAGNVGTTRPMYPAALKQVVAVAALDSRLRPTDWSSRGFWVDCSAVGSGVVSTFVPGTLPTVRPPGQNADPDVTFGPDPFGLWSGTSFSAPQVAGVVASIVQRSDPRVTPRQAFAQLIQEEGQQMIPGFGHVLQILPGTPDE